MTDQANLCLADLNQGTPSTSSSSHLDAPAIFVASSK
jgi:hypothetical protein